MKNLDGLLPDEVIDKLADEKFTGNVTFHFLAGTPRKMKVEETIDLPAPKRRQGD